MPPPNMLSCAILYLETYKFSIIPVNCKTKKPLISWEKYQKQFPTKTELKDWWTKWPTAGIGIITGKLSNLAVIDIDEPQGKEHLADLIPDSLSLPIVVTPGGGEHWYFAYPANTDLRNNTRVIAGCDLRAEGGYVVAPPSRNGTSKQYSWQISIKGVTPPILPPKYLHAISTTQSKDSFSNTSALKEGGIIGGGLRGGEKGGEPSHGKMFVEGSRDNDIFHVANCLIKGGGTPTEALQVLEIIANSCEPKFPLAEVRIKLDSAMKRRGRAETSLAQEVREWVLSSSGVFLSPDVSKCLQVSSREETKNLSKIFGRLVDENIIERCGNKNGMFRLINSKAEAIDWRNASLQGIDIKYPFEIEDYFLTQPKNIIVVAGSSNAGKTAFLLNMAALNRGKYKVMYYSSEMGAPELKVRLSKFNKPIDYWDNVKFMERSDNFSDVIIPEAINIIDFLEIHEDFWNVGAQIKDIFDKLTSGIAVIALQKNPGTDYGLGGARSIEKARLYLSMDSGILKIVKAKNWANPIINPNGMNCNFSLVQGCEFMQLGGWRTK